MSSKQLRANRANAALSTGPKTPEGKAASSRNAVTTALTGRTVLLPADDQAVYQRHLAIYQQEYKPVTDHQMILVQAIADADWRLARIPHLLLALQAKTAEELAGSFPQLEPPARAARLELESYLLHEKQIRNLQLQESRLQRSREKLIAELRVSQQHATLHQRKNLTVAARLYFEAKAAGRPFDPEENGFEFTNLDLEHHLDRSRATAYLQQSRFRP